MERLLSVIHHLDSTIHYQVLRSWTAVLCQILNQQYMTDKRMAVLSENQAVPLFLSEDDDGVVKSVAVWVGVDTLEIG
jgi:hypothetical protein